MDGNAKRSFTIALKKDPKTPCTCNGCPFGICTDYLALCPLPFGEEESSGSNKSLFFMRSKTSRRFIKFTKGRVGESTMRGINNDLNEILPEELRMKQVTAHSGRHTSIQCWCKFCRYCKNDASSRSENFLWLRICEPIFEAGYRKGDWKSSVR